MVRAVGDAAYVLFWLRNEWQLELLHDVGSETMLQGIAGGAITAMGAILNRAGGRIDASD
jgi:hypothetical protein